jgi:hypothetical protein
VSRTFHDHLRSKQSQGQEHGHGHIHGHRSHDHGHGDGPQGDGPKNVADIVAHIGGLSIDTLESAFRSTGLLDQVNAKRVFSARKDEFLENAGTLAGTEFQFLIGSGRRM